MIRPATTASLAALFATALACAALACVALAVPARADDATAMEGGLMPSVTADAAPLAASNAASPAAATVPAPAADEGTHSAIHDYFADWSQRVAYARATQPSWVPPLVTTSPLLLQQVRYDQYWETTPTGAAVDVLGNTKGLELIPGETTEVQLSPPPYVERSIKAPVDGFNDWTFLTVKQRLASGNAQNGDYVISALLAITAPAGITPLTLHTYVVTPTIAAGKSFGPFVATGSLGTAIPLAYEGKLGTQLQFNGSLQLHILRYLWPEFEFNGINWLDGLQRAGKTQLFFTPGIMFGAFPIYDTLKVAVGFGYQEALTPHVRAVPLTPLYDHAWVFSARVPF